MTKLLGWTLAATFLLVAAARPSFAAPTPANVPLPPDRIAQLAKPATVLVETKLTARVTMAIPKDPVAVGEHFGRTDAKLRNAFISDDPDAFERRVMELLAEQPQQFLGPKRSEAYDESGTGSGFVVGHGGAVVTNSHVVLGNGTATDVVESFFFDSGRELVELWVDPAFARKEPALAERAGKAFTDALRASFEVTDIKRTVAVRRLTNAGGQTYTATVARATEAYPAEDLAVLQVAELADTPSLSFGTVEPRAGEEAYALGFPGAATFGVGTDERSQLVPSLTKGVVSASKTSEKGVPVVQFDASLAPGNSGGPLLNNHGEVVGVNVIGADSPGNFNFAIAGGRALGYVSEGGAPLDRTVSSAKLEAAVRSLHAGWLKAAGDHLTELEQAVPSELAVKELREELSGRLARNEKDLTPEEASVTIIGAGAGALLALVTAGTVASAATRNRRRSRSAALPPVEDLSIWTRPA